IPDISSTFFSELDRGLEDIASMSNYKIMLGRSDQKKDKELHLINTMLGKQVERIVFMGGEITEDHISQFKTAQAPVVLSATQDHTKYLPSVNIDYEAAAFEVTRHLIEGTNAQPAIITGGDHVQSNGLKY